MKITIIFPAREVESAAAMAQVMPLAPTLLAALTPDHHDVSLVDMLMGDPVDYDAEIDVVAITVRTPLARIAYEIADRFLERGKKVILGGPHMFAMPEEARQHATAVAIGEGEELWPLILEDIEGGTLRDFYVCGGPAATDLPGEVYRTRQRPDLTNLPMLRRDLLPKERYFMDSVFTTRGCPNHCHFCPVTDIFGGQIRHRPIDEVVAEVDTLGNFYFNVDDSVFGHPQLTDRPHENQYYLDLYAELARLSTKRLWAGAGGLSAVNYKDGRKILELAAQSGLCNVAAGLESISASGQRDSGAWRKLHFRSPDAFDLASMKENIRIMQSLGIQVMGFFVLGWDEDTPDTFRRTLDFCDECKIIPFIFTLTPMPGSRIYGEYTEGGRMLPDLSWDDFGGQAVVFEHPTMSRQEMFEAAGKAMHDGYSMGRILSRTFQALRCRPSFKFVLTSYMTQMGIRKSYRKLYAESAASA